MQMENQASKLTQRLAKTVSRPLIKAITCAWLIVVVFLLAGSSCTASTKHVILIDLSQSARSVFPQYKSGVRQLLEQTQLYIGDSVTVLGITGDSFGHPIILLQDYVHSTLRPKDLELEDCSRFGKDSFAFKSCAALNGERNAKWEVKWQKHFTLERERLLSKWSEKKMAPSSSSTDILGALKYAEQIFVTWKGEKELIIFSDMRHNTRGLDVSKNSKLDSKFLDEVKRRELLPMLKEVSVIVRGVHTENTDPVYFGKLERFWKRLFRESGASLEEFSIDS